MQAPCSEYTPPGLRRSSERPPKVWTPNRREPAAATPVMSRPAWSACSSREWESHLGSVLDDDVRIGGARADGSVRGPGRIIAATSQTPSGAKTRPRPDDFTHDYTIVAGAFGVVMDAIYTNDECTLWGDVLISTPWE